MPKQSDSLTVNASHPQIGRVMTPAACEFLTQLHRQFNSSRLELLSKRARRQAQFDGGDKPNFANSAALTERDEWKVALAPSDLQNRRVEITGPVDRKMMINALNSGANAFMADCEDSLSPGWAHVLGGQIDLQDAVRRVIGYHDPSNGKDYKLNDEVATLLVRPRGWHLHEKHVEIDGESISGSLFDFGLHFFHNAHELLERGSGPYFYLPKLENSSEARLWNEVFCFAQDYLKIPRGTIRATVLLETFPAAFEMDEILFELRDHASGLNAGRWDYLFSTIKTFRNHDGFVLPDRNQLTMTTSFMQAYAELLVQTCHRRGAHAIGGMAAFIPSRDPDLNEQARIKVTADKQREAGQGFDGSWVAHPGLVPICKEVFDAKLGQRPHQKDNVRDDVQISGAQLQAFECPGATITESGMRKSNISVGLQYISAWLSGNGAAAIYNLMEDVATAEISRAQIWQWCRNGAKLDDGRTITTELYKSMRDDELARLGRDKDRYSEAADILDRLVLSSDFKEFLTLDAYGYLE